MTARWFHTLLLGTLLASGGCASSDEADETTTDELTSAAVKSNVAGAVVAVRINDKTFGQKSKVTNALKALNLLDSQARPAETGRPRCMPSYAVTLLGAKGIVLGEGGFFCGSTDGFVTIGTKTYVLANAARATSALDVEARKAVVVSDALAAVGRIKLRVQGGGPMSSSASASSTRHIAGVLAAVPDSLSAETPRCLENGILEFFRDGDSPVATIYTCTASGVSGGVLRGADGSVLGGVKVDWTKIEGLALSWARPR